MASLLLVVMIAETGIQVTPEMVGAAPPQSPLD
jgi:hypothetical protein